MSGPAAHLNDLSEPEARYALLNCCGSPAWVERMTDMRPFQDDAHLFVSADDAWWELGPEDWLEAFSRHPRIGDRDAGGWSSEEQAGVADADATARHALADGNAEYEARFEHVFLICATGLGPEEMLAALKERMDHDPETELRISAGEQAKITRLRLMRLGSE